VGDGDLLSRESQQSLKTDELMTDD